PIVALEHGQVRGGHAQHRVRVREAPQAQGQVHADLGQGANLAAEALAVNPPPVPGRCIPRKLEHAHHSTSQAASRAWATISTWSQAGTTARQSLANRRTRTW